MHSWKSIEALVRTKNKQIQFRILVSTNLNLVHNLFDLQTSPYRSRKHTLISTSDSYFWQLINFLILRSLTFSRPSQHFDYIERLQHVIKLENLLSICLEFSWILFIYTVGDHASNTEILFNKFIFEYLNVFTWKKSKLLKTKDENDLAPIVMSSYNFFSHTPMQPAPGACSTI